MHCPSWNHEQPPEASAKAGAARALLAPLYAWLTDTSAGGLRSAEGFDTRDLKDAKTLRRELGT